MLKTFREIVPHKLRQEIKRILLGRPKICPELYSWARANPSHAEIVKEFWNPHRKQRNKPVGLMGENPPPLFLDNLEYQIFHKTLFRIKNVRIRGQDALLFLPDGSVSQQTGWMRSHITGSKVYRESWRGLEVFKEGNYSSLILFWGLGYYHWFADVLSMLHEAIELLPKDTIFLIKKGFENSYSGEFYIKTLNALGIPRERLLEFDGTESWILENFWWQPPAANTDEQAPGSLRWVGQQISLSVLPSPKEKKSRLYISRRKPSARVVVNEMDLISPLSQLGFQICWLEEMPFEEQVRLFRNAEIVVGPHGAGLTNLIFCPARTQVVEILPEGYEKHFYWGVSTELKLDYRFHLAKAKFPGRRGEPDMEICERDFVDALRALLVKAEKI
jgi:hypothetical protein